MSENPRIQAVTTVFLCCRAEASIGFLVLS